MTQLDITIAQSLETILERLDRHSRDIQDLKDMQRSLDDLRNTVSGFRRELREIKERVSDLQTDLAASRAIRAAGHYQPEREPMIQTGRSAIEPIQAWRRKPGY